MPRTRSRLKLVKLSDALAALGCSRATFYRSVGGAGSWHATFTDPRPAGDRTLRWERKVFDDELAVAVGQGGGPAARVAVLNYRSLMERR